MAVRRQPRSRVSPTKGLAHPTAQTRYRTKGSAHLRSGLTTREPRRVERHSERLRRAPLPHRLLPPRRRRAPRAARRASEGARPRRARDHRPRRARRHRALRAPRRAKPSCRRSSARSSPSSIDEGTAPLAHAPAAARRVARGLRQPRHARHLARARWTHARRAARAARPARRARVGALRAHRLPARLGRRRSPRAATPTRRAKPPRTLMDIFDRRVAIECWDHGLPEERAPRRG